LPWHFIGARNAAHRDTAHRVAENARTASTSRTVAADCGVRAVTPVLRCDVMRALSYRFSGKIDVS